MHSVAHDQISHHIRNRLGWSVQSLQALRSQLCQNGRQLLTGC